MNITCTALAKEDKITQEITSYLENITSVALDFSQTDSDEHEATGTLIIHKPFRFRCNYYAPFPLLILGNKNYVSIYDYEMETLTRIKAKENIFNFLLLDKIAFSQNIEILSTHEDEQHYSLTLRTKDSDKMTEIWFNKTTKQLVKMQIFEEENTISITFGAAHKITHKLPEQLFMIQDPDTYGKPEYLDREKLYKHLKF
jgi:outer membrane lipoprotein-sorting protein